MAKYKKILVYVIILLVFFDNLWIDFLKLPTAIRYLNDVLIFISLIACRKQIRQLVNMNVAKAILFFSVMLLPGLVIHGGAFLLILWAFRNIYRFFAFYFICVFLLDKADVIRIFDIFCMIYYLNLVFCLIEYFILGKTRDYLGGIFGISKGCNSYLNIYLCIVLLYVIYKYLKEKVSVGYMIFILCSAMLIAGLAELKIAFIEIILIIGCIWVMNRNSKSMRTIAVTGVAVIAIGLLVLMMIAPRHFRVMINPMNLLEYANTEDGGYSLSRLHAFSSINDLIFHDNLLMNLFGLGFGNCEYAAVSFLQSPFYHEYGQYHYRWFMHQTLFLETGYAGLFSYIGILATVLNDAWKCRKQQKDEWIHEIVLIMCLLAVMNIWYDASLRSENAYIIWFVLAASAIVSYRRKDDDKCRNL